MLSIEPGFPDATLAALVQSVPRNHVWPDRNLFFGGVHMVCATPDGRFDGAGDPRRGGTVAYAQSS